LREDAKQADPQTAEAMLREGLQHVPGDMGLSGDLAEWREMARTQLVEWFEVCGDADTVSYGRRYLGMYLN
jgi:thioredoxin-like negative regulator of GroEL